MNVQKLLLVGIGGFFGSASRYFLAKTIDDNITRIFPYGTLTVNVAGSFLLGVIYALALKKVSNPEVVSLVLGVGFCGGFTTFSTFAWENMALLQQKGLTDSILYSATSLVLGLLAVWGGFSIVKLIL